MSFFSSFEEMPEPERPERPAHQPWFGVPSGIVPGSVPGTFVVFETDFAALALSHLNAFDDGLQFTLDLWLRDSLGDEVWHAPFEHHRYDPGSRDDADLLQFGFRFGDGSAWANIRPDRPWPDPDGPPRPPLCHCSGGSGGRDHWSFEYWIWPLPPAGETRVFAAWPAHDIAETSIALDTDQIREAAGQARRIWPDS